MSEEEFRLTPKQVIEAKETFKLFDKKGDGLVPTKDLASVFKSLGCHMDAEKLKDWADEADVEAAGVISWDQFEPLYHRKCKMDDEEKELRDAFRVLDPANSNVIPVAYVKDLMQTLVEKCGENITPQEIDEMIALIDADNSGTVDYEEFKALMTS